MKLYLRGLTILLLVCGLATTWTGCSKKDQVDTTKLEKSFQSADPQLQTSANKVVAAVKSQDYASAMGELQKLASQAKLTPEQQQAVKDVLAQVQKAVTDSANKAVEGANKAVGDLQKNLPK